MTPDPGDPLFNLTVLSWVGDRLLAGGQGLWSPTFFFPAEKVLTYSDHLLGPALVFGLLRRAGATPAAAYNTLLLSSFVISGLVTCWVLRRAGCGRFAAFLGGALLAFAPYKWDQLPHIQMLLSPWIPAVLWCWHRFLERPEGRRAAAFLAFYALHLLAGNYLAYLIHLPLAVLWAVRVRELGWRQRAATLGAGAAAGAAMLLVMWPYLAGAVGVHARRSISDYRAWGATFGSFFTASPSWGAPRLEELLPALRAENGLFIGLPFLLLVLLGLWALWRRHHAPAPGSLPTGRRAVLSALLVLAAGAYAAGDVFTWSTAQPEPPNWGPKYVVAGLCLIAAGGGWLILRRRWGGGWPLRFSVEDHWARAMALTAAVTFLVAHPLVFQPLSEVLPGLDRMRVPTRVFPILLVPLASLAANGAAEILRRAREGVERRVAAAALLVVALADLAPVSLTPYMVYLPKAPELPPVYAWLGSAPEVAAVLELPVYADHGELDYQYAWLHHGKPILNGYSGIFPDAYQRLHQACAKRRAASAACLEEARRLGATHVVYHTGRLLFDPSRRRVRREPAAAAGVELVYSDRSARVYRLSEAVAAPAR